MTEMGICMHPMLARTLLVLLCIQLGCASKPDLNSLLIDLKSDSLKRRQGASAGLVNLGQEAIEPLRQLASSELDLTEKRRILDVVEEIQQELINFPPGQPTDSNGVMVTVMPVRRNLVSGDHADLAVELINLGSKPVSVSKVSTVRLMDHPPLSALQFVMEKGEVRIDVESEDSDNPIAGNARADCIKNVELQVIDSGKSALVTIRIRTGRLGEEDVITDGTYKLKAAVNLVEEPGSNPIESNWTSLYVSK